MKITSKIQINPTDLHGMYINQEQTQNEIKTRLIRGLVQEIEPHLVIERGDNHNHYFECEMSVNIVTNQQMKMVYNELYILRGAGFDKTINNIMAILEGKIAQ